MITKQQKVRAIADIQQGKAPKEVARVLRCFIPILTPENLTINDMKYDRMTFDEIRHYLDDVLKVKYIYIVMQ